MSSPSPIAALDAFFNKVRHLTRTKAKQMVLSAEEANDLSAVLGLILAERVRTLEELTRAREDQVIQVEINPNVGANK